MGNDEITKKTKISLELVIALLTIALVGSGVFWNLNGKIASNTKSIEVIKEDIAKITAHITTIDNTLMEMLNQSKLDYALNKSKIGDRWTATMMAIYNDQLSDMYPDLHHKDFPNIKDIQRGEGYD